MSLKVDATVVQRGKELLERLKIRDITATKLTAQLEAMPHANCEWIAKMELVLKEARKNSVSPVLITQGERALQKAQQQQKIEQDRQKRDNDENYKEAHRKRCQQGNEVRSQERAKKAQAEQLDMDNHP